ncbi:MAG TPA: IPT/TIG domain-containing protein [Bacteroides reticulotermitis]|nr:IPT/TIG domain-containing protein [Bacteroides reticulotermitis]
MKRLFIPLLGFLSLALMCCSDNKESGNGSYDPNKPVTIDYFTPDTGRVAEKVIIRGNNFGNDISVVTVLFTDNQEKDNKAAVVGVDNTTIYCIAPRQAEGFNKITVKVNDQVAVADETFKYSVSENVSTIAGDFVETSTGKDGSLAEATFGQMFGVACIDEQSCIVGQAWNSNSTRYVSIDEDAVITIQKGNVIGKVAVSKDRTLAYGAAINGANTVYVYKKSQAWIPSRLCDISGGTDVWALALNGDSQWLYYVTAKGRLGRIEVDNPKNNEILFEHADFSGGPFAYIAYSSFEDCFYVTTDKNKILKVWINEAGKHAYEQINQNNTGTTDGFLVDEAKFQYLRGLTVDEDGNIFVCQGDNHVIRKIAYDKQLEKRYVTTILGTAGVSGTDDGSPTVALLTKPQDISYDGNGGYWIAQRTSPALRKYSVE